MFNTVLDSVTLELEGAMADQTIVSVPVPESADTTLAEAVSIGGNPDSFANLEDKGSWLTFRVTRGGSSIPVRITREAMEDHFEAGKGEKSLAEAYLRHSETINAKALELAPSGDMYSTENPLRLSTADFE
jgi:hypothetical protein